MGNEDDTVKTETPVRDSTVPGDPKEVDVNKLIDVFERNVASQQAMVKRMNQIRWMVAIAMFATIALTLWSKVDTSIVRELAVGAGSKLDAKPQAARNILRKAAMAPKPPAPSHEVVRAKAKVAKKRKAAKAKLDLFLEKRKAAPAPETQPAEKK